ncbi:hypothetical protein [Bacillus sp. ISL-46]|uniref:hypothetical protein n=1 Tax=Bacillus sp. ISL-46 TaxID=2819129 RepID=UPI001BE7192C|nr:hypothetical protein [Bacillus sp. ISL-46]MBT2724836.1 hypothetical protein [Bacillus sp. ISL-46]
MIRRNFLVNLLLWILAFFFGYTIKKEGENLNLLKTDARMVLDKDGNNISEKIDVFSTQLADKATKAQLENISVDVTDSRFGAKFDGVTNDSSAIQTAIDYVSSMGGGTVRLPGGTTKANFTVKRAVSVVGAGKEVTIIKPYSTGAVITYGDGNSLMATLVLKDFTIYGNVNDPTNDGIYFPRGVGTVTKLSGFWECTFRDIFIQYCGRYGMNFSAGDNYQTQQFSLFENIHIRYCKNNGIYAVGNVQNNIFIRVVCRKNGNHGMFLDNILIESTHYNPNDNTFLRCLFENNENGGTCHGIKSKGQRNTYDSCWFERNGLQDTAKNSAGFYNDYPSTSNTMNRIRDCSFRNNYYDIWFYKGNNNILDGNSIMNNDTIVIGKQFAIRIDSLSQNNIFGRQDFSLVGGAVAVTAATTYTATRNQPSGSTTMQAGATSVVQFINEENPPRILVNASWNTNAWTTNRSSSSFTINVAVAPTVDSPVFWRLD